MSFIRTSLGYRWPVTINYLFNVLVMKQLSAHLRKEHEDYRPYECKICNSTFSLSASLVKHMRIHGGEKKYCCTWCGKGFYEQHNLNVSKI